MARTLAGPALATGVIALVLLLVAPGMALALSNGATAPEGPARAPTPSADPRLPLGHILPPTDRSTGAFAGGVDPYLARTTEPAPMGIADFGVYPSGSGYTGYAYSTSEWWADANLSRLLANDGTNATGHASVTFQLNVVVKVRTSAGSDFAYWIQDVARVDTVAKTLLFEDNIWNMSSSAIASTSVVGNGSVYQTSTLEWYADGPLCSGQVGGYPGNCIVLRYPADVQMRVVTGGYLGVPHVAFEYSDGGGGWITYDNASFPFARGGNDLGFVVDGTQYTPIGLFYDAEFDYAGPGGPMTDRSTAMLLSLEFWNGHNLEAPSNAFNFGANTAEQIGNVLALPDLAANGTLAANVTTGPGSLSTLYQRSDIGVLNVTSRDVAGGSVVVGGVDHAFVGHEALLALAPGTYPVVLRNGSGTVAETNVTLPAGGTVHVDLEPPMPFLVHVEETGLPTGTPWSVTVGPLSFTPVGSAVAFNLTNGTYGWSVAPVPGFVAPSYSGSLAVAGTPVTLSIGFRPFVYAVTFVGAGLPSTTVWTVVSGGVNASAAGTSLTLELPNGTFSFSVTVDPTYLPTPSTGTGVVSAAPVLIDIGFSLRPGYLAGFVSPAAAALFVDGFPTPLSAGAFNVSLLPGLHAVEVRAAGFATLERNVSVSAGVTTQVTLVLNSSSSPSPGGPPTPGGSSAGGPGTELLVILAVAVAASAVVALVAARTRRSRR